MFQVVWLQRALDELATIWLRANSLVRQDITAVAHAIDQELQANPERQGESREDEVRICFAYPLGIQFEINADHRVGSYTSGIFGDGSKGP